MAEYKTSIQNKNLTLTIDYLESEKNYIAKGKCPFCNKDFKSRKESTSTGARYHIMNVMRAHVSSKHKNKS